MEPLTPAQGGTSPANDAPSPSDPVYQEDGQWVVRGADGEARGPFATELAAWEAFRASQVGEETPVELDPDSAEAALSDAAQHLVDAAIHLVRHSKSDILIRRADMAALRAAVKQFDLRYAEVVTLGKILALAADAERPVPLGDQVVEATYGEPQEAQETHQDAPGSRFVGPDVSQVGERLEPLP
jgi:hypothetical protein